MVKVNPILRGKPELMGVGEGSLLKLHDRNWGKSPGRPAQLVRALSQYTKVAGSIPGEGTYKKQPMSA